MALLEIDRKASLASIRRAVEEADNQQVELIQCHLDPSCFGMAPELEDLGFRLADTRAVFRTVVHPRDHALIEPPFGLLRRARAKDRSALLALTVAATVDNDAFVSRYKNPRWFSRNESERYFKEWVSRNLDSEETLGCVWEVSGEVGGYFLYARTGEEAQRPVYKGLLAAVAEQHRGHRGHVAMQSHLFSLMPEREVVLDNTTQLTNVAIMRNHIAEQRALFEVRFTFLRSRPGSPA